ncbi:hypothetical protein [Parasediminibacterium sp. JCM 36343]|uniref:hypothetical protein n=1 Tax=Parasediminibacterium sp. JCM 36343 TaxID=3374279 RepID=UPI00397E240C
MKNQMYLFVFCLILISCSSNSLEDRAKKFMKDSIVVNFKDPSSYQLISLKIDTFRIKDHIENIKTSLLDSSLTKLLGDSLDKKHLTELSKLNQDSIENLQINVRYSAKNSFNATIQDGLTFFYYPQTNRFINPN